MASCPFCGFENEEGSFFCEQCKSDLGVEGETPAAAPVNPRAPAGALLEEPGQLGSPPLEALFGLAGGSAPLSSTDPTPLEESPFAFLTAPEPAVQNPPSPIANAPSKVRGESSSNPPGDPPKTALTLEATTSPPAVAAPVRPFKKSPPAPPAPTAPVVPSSASASTVPAPTPARETVPAGAQPHLVVVRGRKINAQFPLYRGQNYIGRADDKAVDIDLEDQEPPDRVWSSREHAVIHFEHGMLALEDLSSRNGTFLNRDRIPPGQKIALNVGDVIQIGTVQMKVEI